MTATFTLFAIVFLVTFPLGMASVCTAICWYRDPIRKLDRARKGFGKSARALRLATVATLGPKQRKSRAKAPTMMVKASGLTWYASGRLVH